MDAVELKIITKSPPHGRCRMYSSIVWLVISTFKNVKISIIPDVIKNHDDPDESPCVVVNGKQVESSNAIYVSGNEIFEALKRAGALAYDGVVPDNAEFEKTLEQYLQ